MKPARNGVYANNPQRRRIVSFERKFYEQFQTREGGASGRVEGSGGGKQKFTNGCGEGGVSGARVEGGARGAIERIGRSVVEGSGRGAIERIGRSVVEGSGDGKRKITTCDRNAVELRGGIVERCASGAIEGIGRSVVGDGKPQSGRSAIEVRGGGVGGGAYGAIEGSGRNAFEGSGYGKRKLTKSCQTGVEVIGGGVKGGARGAIEGIGRSATEGSYDRKLKHSKIDLNAVEVSGGGVERSASGAVIGIGRRVVERSGDGKGKLTSGYHDAAKVSGGDKGKLTMGYHDATKVRGGDKGKHTVYHDAAKVSAGDKGKVTKTYRSAVEVSGGGVMGGANGAVEEIGRGTVEEIDDGKRKLTKSDRSSIEVSGVEVEGGATASGAVVSIGRNAVEGSSGSKPRLTTMDGFVYLAKVKKVFAEQIEIYNIFVDMMVSYKERRFDVDEVKPMVKEMFEDHPDLIVGFNGFLPEGQEITIINKETIPEEKPKFEDAVAFLRKIKGHFGADHHVYKSFVEMLYMSERIQRTVFQVYQEVAIIFKGHPDFVEEFKKFLPEN